MDTFDNGRVEIAYMKFWSVGLSILLVAAFVGRANAQGRGGAPTAGQFFKNVTTTSLKGLSVDEFLETMGVISSRSLVRLFELPSGSRSTDKARF